MKIVRIAWSDSKGITPEWEIKEDMGQLRPACVDSVGFLLEDRDDYVTIAQSDTDDQVLGRLTIPRGCIKEISVIRE